MTRSEVVILSNGIAGAAQMSLTGGSCEQPLLARVRKASIENPVITHKVGRKKTLLEHPQDAAVALFLARLGSVWEALLVWF